MIRLRPKSCGGTAFRFGPILLQKSFCTGDQKDAVNAVNDGQADALFFPFALDSAILHSLLINPRVRPMNFTQAEALTRIFPHLVRLARRFPVSGLAQGPTIRHVPRRHLGLRSIEDPVKASAGLDYQLGSRLIKSTIPARRRGRQKPGNFAPACRSGLRCAGNPSIC